MARSRRKIAEGPVPDRIAIPDLVGTIVAGALRQAELVGFTLVIADPPAELSSLQMSGRWVVANQEPAAGSTRFRGDTVVVTLRRDGGDGAGDREPRRPLPPRLAARAALDDLDDLVRDDLDDLVRDEPRPSSDRPRGGVSVGEEATVLRFERRDAGR